MKHTLLLIFSFFSLSIRIGFSQASIVSEKVQTDISNFKFKSGLSHPYILLDTKRIAELKSGLASTHSYLWNRYLQDLPYMLSVSKREIPLDDARYDGDLISELAFAWLMTGRDDILNTAKFQLLRLARDEEWATKEDLIYLVPAHYLMGMAIGYDWLYSELSPDERALVSGRLGREAESQYNRITKERVWWRNQYVQNHSQSNTAALAFAAVVLSGEDMRSQLWLKTASDFFETVFSMEPKDGSSYEGYAYAGYGAEYVLLYTLMAKDLLNIDYTVSPWMQHFSEYLLHGLLPKRIGEEWAMTFGDAPRRGWTSTAQHLFTLAGFYHDSIAQWMALETIGLKEKGLRGTGWLMMLSYDPSIKPADPATFPTFKHFPEIDQVMMRSSWTDPNATLVGFKCGPFLGHTVSPIAKFDYGTGHQETDAGSFQLFSHGQFLAIDPGYTGRKKTENENTMLFKGHGQLGELAGFGSAEALLFHHFPEIVYTHTTKTYDYVVGDVTKAYHPALGLTKYVRHMLFIKPDILLIADEMQLKDEGTVIDYKPQMLETSGGLSHASNGYVIGKEGKASFVFDGEPGNYKIAAIYLDNVPGVGRYSFEVDGKQVYSWTSQNQDRDDNLSALSKAVFLKKGTRVSFCAAPMSEGSRLTKVSVFSESVKSRPEATWMLQLDPASKVSKVQDHLEAVLGNGALDIFNPLADKTQFEWNLHPIEKADAEPFTYRNTIRIDRHPVFKNNESFMLTLLNMRSADKKCPEGVHAEKQGEKLVIFYSIDGQRTKVSWDLKARLVQIANNRDFK